MSTSVNYDYLLSTLSKPQWQRIGLNRRSGAAVPLFSIYSNKSVGIGEFPDLKLLIDWCKSTSISIVQLLPLNDVGFNFRPYDAESSFALDPMYLSLEQLKEIDLRSFKEKIKKIRERFPVNGKRVNYQIKAAKLELLRDIFSTCKIQSIASFDNFCKKNRYWLDDYALFKVLKELNQGKGWEEWRQDLKEKEEGAITLIKQSYQKDIEFHKWLQWQLYEQFIDVKEYATELDVLLMGDLPFLVSRDSADVWSHQSYFKLGLAAGAPPDMLYSKGQRWGMPPYNWENIARNNYDYLIEKLKYSENFYDLFRIDHVVGVFRVWTISLSEPFENGGLNGAFDPVDENQWEEHGRRILSTIILNTRMLACAEDLGVVPKCSSKILEEFGIPGIDIQRWIRDWGKTYDFKAGSGYRKNSIATISTHDMSGLLGWWTFEAGTVDSMLFERKCREKNIDFENIKSRLFDLDKSFHGRLRWKKDITNKNFLIDILGQKEQAIGDLIDLYSGSFGENEKFLKFLGASVEKPEQSQPSVFIKKALEAVNQTDSIFGIQLLQDWLSLDCLFECDPWELRINFPGTISDKNWSLLLPLPLEDMLDLPVNQIIKSINEQSLRQ